jgi:hypothetical protein
MNFAVDPDVFQASFLEIPCLAALNEIGRDFASHRFLRDAEGVLEREYRQIFNEKYKTGDEHPAVVLLQRILFDDGNPEDTISSINPITTRLVSLGCSHPVEPELLGMLANARNLGLILAMVGHDADYLRKRGLHDETVRWRVCKEIPWLDIKWIGESRVEIPENDYSANNPPSIRAKQDAFESKVALWLQDDDPSLRCITPPSKGKVGNEQIDVYGYRDASTGKTVVVGECKLRREGNEEKQIAAKEIQQLRRKVIAARKYEEAKKSLSRDGISVEYEGILISNAIGVEDQAQRLIESETDFKIRVLHVTIKKGWETSDELCITQGRWRNS